MALNPSKEQISERAQEGLYHKCKQVQYSALKALFWVDIIDWNHSLIVNDPNL
jgi:hypothetical protein